MPRRSLLSWSLVFFSIAGLYVLFWYIDEGQTMFGAPFTIIYPIGLCLLLSLAFLLFSRMVWRPEGER